MPRPPGGPNPRRGGRERGRQAGAGAGRARARRGARAGGGRELPPQLHEVALPVGWVAFSAACASSLVATARFLFPNVLFEPPQSFKAGFPGEYNVGEVDTRWKDAFGVWIVREPDGLLRAHRGLHAPRLLAQLAGRREQVQVPLPRQRLLPDGRELRGPGAAAAGARAHRARRRRPDPGRQVGEVPAGEGRVDQRRVVPEGLMRGARPAIRNAEARRGSDGDCEAPRAVPDPHLGLHHGDPALEVDLPARHARAPTATACWR